MNGGRGGCVVASSRSSSRLQRSPFRRNSASSPSDIAYLPPAATEERNSCVPCIQLCWREFRRCACMRTHKRFSVREASIVTLLLVSRILLTTTSNRRVGQEIGFTRVLTGWLSHVLLTGQPMAVGSAHGYRINREISRQKPTELSVHNKI